MKGFKIGETYDLLFYTHSAFDVLLQAEKLPIHELYSLMVAKPKMRIRIQGYAEKKELINKIQASDVQPSWRLKSDFEVSVDRVNEVYHDLLNLGIQAGRMEKEPLGSEKIPFPNPKNEEERNKNKKVAIKILSM